MNTKDIKVDNMKLLVLVYGSSGTGKTTFAGTFPKPYFFDFDRGMLSLRGKNIDYDTYEDPLTGAPEAKRKFDEKLRELQALKTKEGVFPFQTIVLDSLTTLQEVYMADIQATNRTQHKNPNIGEWGILINGLQDVLYKLCGLDCHVVVTAHEQIVQDDLSGEVNVLPLVSGKKLPDRIPLLFDEVYNTRVERGSRGVPSYECLTRASRKYKAKSRLDCLEEKEKGLTYAKIIGKIQSAQ